uniref:Uncharacterized protein n=1 Tax=Panagrolaimus sp. PS1159 TaxID=55785 RepID=A0AC35FW67_9BILA
MSINIQHAFRSFTRSILLKTGRNFNYLTSDNNNSSSSGENDVTLVFIVEDGTQYFVTGKEGECLCNLANKYGFDIHDPVTCILLDPPTVYYADNMFYNNLPGPGQSKLDKELIQLRPKKQELRAEMPITKEFEHYFISCTKLNKS